MGIYENTKKIILVLICHLFCILFCNLTKNLTKNIYNQSDVVSIRFELALGLKIGLKD